MQRSKRGNSASWRRSSLWLPAVLLLAVLTVTASADIVRERLSNGVRVVVEPSPWNRIISVSVLVDAGSKHDPSDARGLAKVTNSLLGYTTASRSSEEVCRIAACEWVDFGTTVTEDFSEVYAASVDEHFVEALDLVAGAVIEPSFTREDLAAVQVATQREIERGLDDPFERSYMKLNELLFDGHPYAFPVMGTLDGVARIAREDVVRFHGERYTGGAIAVSIVGNVDPEEAIELVRERFQGLPSGAPDGRIAQVEREDATASDLFKDVETGRVQFGYLAPAAGDPDYAPVRVLTEILGGGSGSRLSAALTADGADVADIVGAFYPLRTEQGRLVIYATPKQIDLAVSLIGDEVEELRTEPVAESELQRARQRIAGLFRMKGQRNLDRARRYAWDELSGLGPGAHDRLVEAVEAVGVDDVLKAARRYLVNPAVVVLRPGRSGRDGGI